MIIISNHLKIKAVVTYLGLAICTLLDKRVFKHCFFQYKNAIG